MVHVNHALIYAVFIVGNVLSNLYVPFHVALFHAKSVAHRYNVLSHSVLSEIKDPFEYEPPALIQFAALTRLYFAVPVFASVCVNIIEIFVFFHVVEELVALTTGLMVSNTIVSVIVLVVLDHQSFNCIDTVFVPLVLSNVHHVVFVIVDHQLQLVQSLENLIWIGVQLSTHVILLNTTVTQLA